MGENKEEKLKFSIMPTFVAFIITFLIINLYYAATHYAFGEVRIPDWYLKDTSERMIQPYEPIPIMETIKYWINRGMLVSFVWGIGVAIATFIISIVEYRKSLNSTISKSMK